MAAATAAPMGGESQRGLQKEKDVRSSNIMAAKAVADAIRTSLGPRGMDKMIQKADGEVLITNDGATILSQMEVFHPTAKMLVELSKSQDIEAGDGTTSVCVIAGSLLNACYTLLQKGIHPTAISEAFQLARDEAMRVLESMSRPLELSEREQLINAVNTCISSKVVAQNSETISPIAVDAVLGVIDAATATNVDLESVKIVKQVGGTIDDTELVPGLVFPKGAKKGGGGPTRVADAKIGLIQFCLSAPKTDMENNVIVSDYAAMDRILREERKHVLGLCKKIKKAGCNVLLIQKSILREERKHVLGLCKKIKKAGCNVLLIQKSILRDAYNDLSLHFLGKMDIMVITDVERNDVEFIARTVGCQPVAHIDTFTADKMGGAELVEENSMPGATDKVVKVTGVANPGRTSTILMRGGNKLVLEEAERSVHDALCVVRSLVKRRFLISGGGSAETEVALRLGAWSKTQTGMKGYCIQAYAEALELIPYTLAENAGLSPIAMVTELRRRHADGEAGAGINVRRGAITDMYAEDVVQPMLVTTSMIGLATECVCMILKIDDIVGVR